MDLGGLHQQLAALQLASGAERISPTLDAILELLDESPAEEAAAEAEEFVAQVAAAASSSGAGAPTLALPWARRGEAASAPLPEEGDAQAAEAEGGEGGEQQAGEASMEGVVAEYAHAAAPDPADAGEGAALLGAEDTAVVPFSRLLAALAWLAAGPAHRPGHPRQ